jgi:tetratricopeptide (TPR) repeat protein
LPLLTGLAQAGSKSSINLKAGVSAKDSSAEASAKGSSSDGVVPSDVPRDPRGIKGISPVWEEIAAGDAAIAANDVDKALKHYEAALKADSRSALAHYRLGEARKAKALFALAALAERQNKLSEARSAWKRYQEHVEKHGEIKAFPASASERLRRLDAQEQLSKDYALVRDRIKKGDAASKK